MPATDGSLTEREKAKVRNWFANRAAKAACESCGGRKWTLSGHVVHVPVWTTEYRTEVSSYPAVVVVCQGCAHMRFYSALGVGLCQEDIQEPARRRSGDEDTATLALSGR